MENLEIKRVKFILISGVPNKFFYFLGTFRKHSLSCINNYNDNNDYVSTEVFDDNFWFIPTPTVRHKI